MTSELVLIRQEIDVRPFLNRVSTYATNAGLGLVSRTKLVTAASELVRNMLLFANGGEVAIELVSNGRGNGVRLSFRDQGPGIADIPQVMQDGFTTRQGMGVGLPGARRLVSEFAISSTPGEGTTIIITTWQHD